MLVKFSGLLAVRVPTRFPLVVMEAGALTFDFHPDPRVMRQRIEEFKLQLDALDDAEKVDLPTEHEFIDGMYIRKMHLKKGEIVVGKIHRKACINFVERGDITVTTATGMARIQAGFNVVSPAGLRKVGIAHEDTVFVNVFRTDLTSIEEIEREFACNDYEEYESRLAIEGN